jgi:hypothetical protein
MNPAKYFLNLACVVFLPGLAGCSSPHPAAPERLDAALLSPADVQLKWRNAPGAAGQIVEWATTPDGPYVILAFLWPQLTSFVHADVVPETTSYYRVRPYFGSASDAVEITTGKAPPAGTEISFDPTWNDPKIIPASGSIAKTSIRNNPPATAAAPTDLKAELIHPTGILLTWTDHADDEEGYFIEIKTAESPGFHLCAVVGPDINSFGYALVPPETRVSFRVRAFYYGKPSNVAQQTTGALRR